MFPWVNSKARSLSLGFSLAELMAAMVILTVALFAVISVNASTLRQTRYNERLQTANTIATMQMAIAESVLRMNFQCTSGLIDTPVMASKEFDTFFYQIKDQGFVPGSNQKLRSISVGVLWKEGGIDRRFQLDTTFYDY